MSHSVATKTSPRDLIRDQLQDAEVFDSRGERFDLSAQRDVRVVIGRVLDDDPTSVTCTSVGATAPDRLVRGAAAVALVCGAERMILAVPSSSPAACARIEAAAHGTRVEVARLAPRYPLDADSLRCDLAALSPGAAGALRLGPAVREQTVVLDAVVLTDVALALEGRSLGRRAVSVAGAVHHPGVFQVPLGTSMTELVAATGGATAVGWVAVHNGWLGGEVVSTDFSVDLCTRSLLVLPPRHPLMVRITTPLSDELARARSACVGCCACTDACPVHLCGGPIAPDVVMRRQCSADAPNDGTTGAAAGACIDCGLCTLRCPASLDPARAMRRARKTPAPSTPSYLLAPHPDRELRRSLATQVASWLGIDGSFDGAQLRTIRNHIPDELVISLQAPDGSLRIATVQAGDVVSQGDRVAIAHSASLTIDIRAPVAGRVVAVDERTGLRIACA